MLTSNNFNQQNSYHSTKNNNLNFKAIVRIHPPKGIITKALADDIISSATKIEEISNFCTKNNVEIATDAYECMFPIDGKLKKITRASFEIIKAQKTNATPNKISIIDRIRSLFKSSKNNSTKDEKIIFEASAFDGKIETACFKLKQLIRLTAHRHIDK